MSLEFLNDLIVPIILAASLCIGYVLKHWMPTDNKWIPTILLIFGVISGFLVVGVSYTGGAVGGLSGLAAVGLHQLFKQFIDTQVKIPVNEAPALVLGGNNVIRDQEMDDNVEILEEDLEELDGIGGTFSPRLSAPSESNKYYLKRGKGGYNPCILISGKSCIPNCVGYGYGRAYEVLGKDPKLCVNNASDWYDHKDSWKRVKVSELQAGDIICWDDGLYGHIGFVEMGTKKGQLTISQSAYGGRRFYITKMKYPYNFGAYKCVGGIRIVNTTAETKTLKVGSIIKIRKGAKQYGKSAGFADFVYTTKYKVIEISGDRVVFATNDRKAIVIGAVRKADCVVQ